ncbi:MAG: M12 family metallopeptidase [Acidobacteriota bacterium]
MQNQTRPFTQGAFTFLLLITICWLGSSVTNAQNTRPTGVPDGYSVIDGDILMPTAYVEAVLKRQKLSPNVTEAAYTSNVWRVGVPPFETRGIVPFEFNPNVSAANQSAMISAMAVLENVANVDFRQCPNNVCIFTQTNFVHILDAPSNSSMVGMIGGEQLITIASWDQPFKIVHELMHCLGFYHEQQRPDRDTFVQINCANVQGGCSGTIYNSNFLLLSAVIYGTYDFDSVMHYDKCGFSIDCPPGSTCVCTNTVMTFLMTPPAGVTVGQRNHLSSLDGATVSFLYPFDNWSLLDCTYNGSNGTSNGSFSRPYTTLASALASTPAGGTIWVLKNCTFPSGTYSNQVTIKAAPGVVATFGS